jgi:S1-C subfamily serine protease
VDRVVPGSPAALLQLDPGDVITSVNGARVATGDGFREALAAAPDEIWFEIINVRTGLSQAFVATLDRRKPPPPDPGPDPGLIQTNLTFGVHGYENAGYGIYVWSVRPDSPAAKMGLERHDLILALDGREIYSIAQYRDAVAHSGGRVAVTFRDCRTGQIRQAEAVLDTHPRPANASDQSVLGVFGVQVAGGIQVRSVVPGSPANQVGLDPGDVITSVNGAAVSTVSDLHRVVRTSPDEMILTVLKIRTGRLLGMVVQLDRCTE